MRASNGPLTDRSGTISAGGTAQQLAAANVDRHYLFILNLSTSVLWINFGIDAVQGSPSIPLAAATNEEMGDGGALVFEGSFVPSQAVSIIGSQGASFVAKEG